MKKVSDGNTEVPHGPRPKVSGAKGKKHGYLGKSLFREGTVEKVWKKGRHVVPYGATKGGEQGSLSKMKYIERMQSTKEGQLGDGGPKFKFFN